MRVDKAHNPISPRNGYEANTASTRCHNIDSIGTWSSMACARVRSIISIWNGVVKYNVKLCTLSVYMTMYILNLSRIEVQKIGRNKFRNS